MLTNILDEPIALTQDTSNGWKSVPFAKPDETPEYWGIEVVVETGTSGVMKLADYKGAICRELPFTYDKNNELLIKDHDLVQELNASDVSMNSLSEKFTDSLASYKEKSDKAFANYLNRDFAEGPPKRVPNESIENLVQRDTAVVQPKTFLGKTKQKLLSLQTSASQYVQNIKQQSKPNLLRRGEKPLWKKLTRRAKVTTLGIGLLATAYHMHSSSKVTGYPASSNVQEVAPKVNTSTPIIKKYNSADSAVANSSNREQFWTKLLFSSNPTNYSTNGTQSGQTSSRSVNEPESAYLPQERKVPLDKEVQTEIVKETQIQTHEKNKPLSLTLTRGDEYSLTVTDHNDDGILSYEDLRKSAFVELELDKDFDENLPPVYNLFNKVGVNARSLNPENIRGEKGIDMTFLLNNEWSQEDPKISYSHTSLETLYTSK